MSLNNGGQLFEPGLPFHSRYLRSRIPLVPVPLKPHTSFPVTRAPPPSLDPPSPALSLLPLPSPPSQSAGSSSIAPTPPTLALSVPGGPHSSHLFISNHSKGCRALRLSSQRSHFSSAGPVLCQPAPSRLPPHTCLPSHPSGPSTCYSPRSRATEGAGPHAAYLCGALRVRRWGWRRLLRPRRSSCVSDSSAAGGHSRGGARTGSGAAGPQPRARGGVGAGPHWTGAGPKAGSGQKGTEGRGQAEVTSRDGPARSSRWRKRTDAGGSFRQWESADIAGFRCEDFRAELERAGGRPLLAFFLVAGFGVAQRPVGRKRTS
ncbi:translation initiation factor IF-2-like [Lutra lutra]|uniref:translation initiation factor IF-2-like n=1 Tax=Lutra lutra TaxID=9657 RepID=UPI001FD2391F|nr:translation initiation factor IF-2-like [Lutra lutra]